MKDTNIALISYNQPTRKIQEILFRLVNKEYKNVTVVALPFILRGEKRVAYFNHRPIELIEEISLHDLVNRYNYTIIEKKMDDLFVYFKKNIFDVIVIGGAGILPKKVAQNFKIINSHPGYLPYVRGVDAFKWAIYNKYPLKVTVHFIDETADAGKLIYQEKIVLQANDTLQTASLKLWNLEMDLLVNAIELIKKVKVFPKLSQTETQPNKRMKYKHELELDKKFEEYKLLYI